MSYFTNTHTQRHVLLNDRDMFREMHIEEISRLFELHRVQLHNPKWYSQLHSQAISYSLLFLDYKPVQLVIIQNIVSNCNTILCVYLKISKHRNGTLNI